jgi:hypothetical protein
LFVGKRGDKKRMSKPYGGSEATLAYVPEVTYGVTPTTPAMIQMTAENVTPAIDPSLLEVRGIGSRDLSFLTQGLRMVDLKFAYYIQGITELALAISLGSISAEVYYERASSIISLLHKGCIVDKVTVACPIDTLPTVSMDCIGQDLVVGTAKVGTTYTPYTTSPVQFFDSYVKKATAIIERVTAWKFTIENHLKRVPVIRTTGGRILKYLMERQRSISGEIEFDFESKEEYDDVVNDVSFALELGLGSTNKAAFTNCKWKNVGSPTKVEDLITLKAPFIAKAVTIS